jgi:LPXTG-motif cell wall-anchored protein
LIVINQETEKLENKMKISALNSKRGLGILSVLFVGIIAGNQYLAVAAEGIQTSSISSMSVSNTACTTSGYSVTLTGSFPEVVTNIAVSDNNLAPTSWVQSATTIQINGAVSTAKTVTIQVFNGQVPLLAVQSFNCVEPIVVAPPVTETETGGELPDTGSNNYNYLLAGVGLAFAGSTGLMRRKQLQK